MYRRAYLAVCSTVFVAGCSSGDGESGDGATPPDTATEAATAIATETEEMSGEVEYVGSPEFEIAAYNFPEEVQITETFRPSIEIRNTGDTNGDYGGALYFRVEDSDWVKEGTWQWQNIEPGQTKTVQANGEWSLPWLYDYEISLGDFDKTTTVTTVPYQASVGESFTAHNKARAEVTDIRLTARYEYQDYDDETAVEEAPDGKQWALVTMEAENTADEAVDLPETFDISLLSDQSQFETATIRKEDREYEGGEVQPGIVRNGWIAFEIPDDISHDDLRVVWSTFLENGDIAVYWSQT